MKKFFIFTSLSFIFWKGLASFVTDSNELSVLLLLFMLSLPLGYLFKKIIDFIEENRYSKTTAAEITRNIEAYREKRKKDNLSFGNPTMEDIINYLNKKNELN
jgi:hypothetical protein